MKNLNKLNCLKTDKTLQPSLKFGGKVKSLL
jgi:hypothetical protein